MTDTKVIIDKDTCKDLIAKIKLFNTFFAIMEVNIDRVLFNLTTGKLSMMLLGRKGGLQVSVDVDYSGNEPYYFSVDFRKWMILLQKYMYSEFISFDISKSSVTVKNSLGDAVQLSVIYYAPDSSQAELMKGSMDQMESEFKGYGLDMTLTPDFMGKLDIATCLFHSASEINAIGFNKRHILFYDIIGVMRLRLDEQISDSLFSYRGDTPIYIHKNLAMLLKILYEFNDRIYFSEDYKRIYWEDQNTRIIYQAPDALAALPSEEEWNGIIPENPTSTIATSIKALHETMLFFSGFFDQVNWQVVNFENVGNAIQINYNRPTTSLSKILATDYVSGNPDYSMDTVTIIKALSKMTGIESFDDAKVLITSSPETEGILLSVKDGECELMLPKMKGDLNIV